MSELTINTTQNVNINFTAASVGERIGAYLLDFLIKAAYFIALILFLIYVIRIDKIAPNMDFWTAFAIYSIISLPVTFYSLFFETWLEGQTLGKRILKIKVVKIDGYQASFGDYLIRWVFRLVDIASNGGIVGLISIVVTEKTQRLGDMASGTAVITLKNKITISNTILEDIGDSYVPIYPLVIKLTDNDMRIVKETFNNALAKNDVEMINKLTNKIEKVTGIQNQSGNNKDFIRTILKDYNFYTQNM
jgi:uncharacterized RDD family membrane protein YckC